MNRDARMKLVVKTRAAREREAASAVARAQNQFQQQRQYLEDLLTWQSEYQQRADTQQSSATMSATQFGRWRQFRSGLEQAIQQQREVVSRSEQQLAAAVNRWRQAALNTRAVEDLQTRLETEIRLESERAEQEEIDDLTCRVSGFGGTFNG